MNSNLILSRLKKMRESARQLRTLSTEVKNHVLETGSRLILENQDQILKANRKDLKLLETDRKLKSRNNRAFQDRLTLDESRIVLMAKSLQEVAALPDPIGEVTESKALLNGLQVKRVRSPLGVILMIFESRPNVAIEAFSLAFKSGNAIILRGGSESMHTTHALYQVLGMALKETGLSSDLFWGIKDADRKIPQFLLKQKEWIDVVVPRGGDRLIEFVTENSRIPIIKNDRGLCHVYVHEDADLEMAEQVVLNAKTQRPGVCNAMETLLIHEKVADLFLPRAYELLSVYQVRWNTCPRSYQILKGNPSVHRASPKSWDTEYLDYEINCRVVSSLEEALAHIDRHGSRHSEAILTQSKQVARIFQSEVDAAATYWNASTRFTDGFELGLGGELGVSTQKLHVRGPIGLRELTSIKWVIDGTGQVRK